MAGLAGGFMLAFVSCDCNHNPKPLPRSRPPAGVDCGAEYDVDHGAAVMKGVTCSFIKVV